MISAKVIADSWDGKTRITTLEATFHRFILPEVLTHRAFSRNTASSRAIPVAKQIQRIKENPAMPIFWGKAQSGMSAYKEVEDPSVVKFIWKEAMDKALNYADWLLNNNLHKQLASRIIEPYMWTTMIISATEWDNFFELRRPPGGVMDPQFPAQPEMQQLAIEIYNAREKSDPVFLTKGQWHVPYTQPSDEYDWPELIRISAARCARVSYLTHDGKKDIQKDLELTDRLIRDKHMSPMEHQARCVGNETFYANFRGFTQFRRFVENSTSFVQQET